MANQTISLANLLPGDVLLYHGTSFLSDLIRLFDGSTYSHASIYDGAKILEALGGGITSNTVAASVAGAKFVDVYRFQKDGKSLTSPTYPTQPLLDRIRYYKDNGQRYAYEEILLLAILASTRRIPVPSWIPGLSLILRSVMDHAADILANLMAGGKQPVICSELVYRCYEESGDGRYHLDVVGADVLAPAFAASAMMAALPVAAPAVPDPLDAARAVFLARYAAAKGKPAAAFPIATAAGGISIAAVSDFVTPRDLSVSPNLVKVGTLSA